MATYSEFRNDISQKQHLVDGYDKLQQRSEALQAILAANAAGNVATALQVKAVNGDAVLNKQLAYLMPRFSKVLADNFHVIVNRELQDVQDQLTVATDALTALGVVFNGT